jgi:hypothetical protein
MMMSSEEPSATGVGIAAVRPHQDPLIVIGNGPSLRGFDFGKLCGFACLGMNAAYRYWETINWYPTYYCCLDDELIATHHESIFQLLDTGRVERIFVTAAILEFHPELASDRRVDFLDSFIPYLYRTRGSRYGLRQVTAEVFRTSNPDKLTTGSHSVRYGLWLGYQKVLMLGIDCKYVQRVRGARHDSGLKMHMEATPDRNENYFFDDYQRAGDRFQVPNPEVHGGNLHLQSFEVLRDDLIGGNVTAKVINCNTKSELYVRNVFPYEDFDRATQRNLLGAVIVPTTERELPAVLANFRLWDRPGHVPFLVPPPDPDVYLHFVLNGAPSPEFEEAVNRAFRASAQVERCFAGLRFDYCCLQGDADVYDRTYTKSASPSGFKSGPNNQFFLTIERFARGYPYVFLMETDCFPIKADWLRRLLDIANAKERFWIKGSIYRGVSTLGVAYQAHINGNAIYASGDPAFHEFIRDIWKPYLEKTVREVDRRLAYDIAVALCFHSASAHVENNERWHQWQNLAHRFVYTEFIQNHSGTRDAASDRAPSIEDIRSNSPETYIVHGGHFRVQLDAQLDAQLANVATNQADSLRSGNGPLSFVFRHINGTVEHRGDDTYEFSGKVADNYVCYIFSHEISPGDSIVGQIEAAGSDGSTLVMSLNRHGATQFEGAMQRFPLNDSRRVFSVVYSFRLAHPAVRLQISVEGSEGSRNICIRQPFIRVFRK